MILTYCSASKMTPVRPEALVQTSRRSFKTCRHFVDTVLQKEARQGELLCGSSKLAGSLEVDATSIGKWWVPRSHTLLQDQIQALEARSKKHEAYPVHWRILGIRERKSSRIVVKFLRPVSTMKAMLQAVLPRGRPPIESFREIMQSKILDRATRNRSCLYADGAKSWQKASVATGFKCVQVSHTNREYCKVLSDSKVPKNCSTLAGTQCLDSDWGVLK